MKVFLIAIAVLVFAPVAYCQVMYPTYTYRYKMTVEVDTPEGVKSGSSVIEVTTRQWPESIKGLSSGHYNNMSIEGESVFIDLGNGKNLVTLLATGQYAQDYRDVERFPARAFLGLGHQESYQNLGLKWAKRLVNMVGQKASLRPEHRPTLVTFSDVNDPESIQLVYASEVLEYREKRPSPRMFKSSVVADHFEYIFGKGYALKDITIEITNENPTDKQVSNKLPLLNGDGRPEKKAWRALLGEARIGKSIEPELLIKRSK